MGAYGSFLLYKQKMFDLWGSLRIPKLIQRIPGNRNHPNGNFPGIRTTLLTLKFVLLESPVQ